MRAWLLAMCVLETVMRPSLFPGRLCMRQLIGSLLLLAAVGLAPAELAAQRRPAARAAASRADRPSFGLQLDWGNDPNFGIGGRGVRSEEHTSELQSRFDLVCRLLLEKK